MARLTTLIASLLLCLMTATALPVPQNDILRRIANMLQKAQATTAPPASNLPAPMDGLSLKYVGLGLGTQNYTCATSDDSTLPVAVGARANLFDATQAMVGMTASPFAGQNKLMSIGTCAADKANTNGQNKVQGMNLIGQHYFDAAGVPTFDLSPENMLLKAKKIATDPAPSDACVGRDGGAAVAWLMLNDDGTGRSQGLSQVFRVETAGGSAPATCAGQQSAFTRDYAAYYYLYGQ